MCVSHTHVTADILRVQKRFLQEQRLCFNFRATFQHLCFIFFWGGGNYAFISSVHLLTALFEFQCSVLFWDLHIFWTLSFCQHKFITSTDFSLTLYAIPSLICYLCCAEDFSYMRFHLSVVGLISWLAHFLFKSLPMVLPIFSSNSFRFPGVAINSLIHLSWLLYRTKTGLASFFYM